MSSRGKSTACVPPPPSASPPQILEPRLQPHEILCLVRKRWDSGASSGSAAGARHFELTSEEEALILTALSAAEDPEDSAPAPAPPSGEDEQAADASSAERRGAKRPAAAAVGGRAAKAAKMAGASTAVLGATSSPRHVRPSGCAARVPCLPRKRQAALNTGWQHAGMEGSIGVDRLVLGDGAAVAWYGTITAGEASWAGRGISESAPARRCG